MDNIRTVMVQTRCWKCNHPIEVETISGATIRVLCDPCYDIEHSELMRKMLESEESDENELLMARGLSPHWEATWDCEKAYRGGAMLEWVIKHADRNIALISPLSGVNKTWSLGIMAWRLAKSGQVKSPMFIVYPDWMAKVMSLRSQDAKSSEREVEKAMHSDLLVIDDIGRGSVSDFTSGILWRIINYRTKPSFAGRTWITANYRRDELATRLLDHGPTIVRRIENNFTFPNSGNHGQLTRKGSDE